MRQIQASAGLGSLHRPADVGIIQQLLTNAGEHPGPIDRRCGRLTISAIERFQRRVLRRPDGRVDVHGSTWRRLTTMSPTTPAPATRNRVTTVPTAPATLPRKAAPAATPATPSGDRRAFWKAETALPARGSVNHGLSSPGPERQIRRFGGRPSEIAYRNGGPVTNAKLRAPIVTEDVGPFRATGIRPAVASLRGVLSAVRRELPELYPLLGNAGMLVNRLQRGSRTKLSNHAFGTAIDFYIDRYLTQRGSHRSNRGLDALAPFFHRAGWYWGATFPTDDAMHFECSTSLLDSFGL